MHLPDGLLSPPVWLATDALALGALGLSVRRASRALTDRQIPLMGVLGAFVFAAQMVNFPVPGGTSGHLMGSVLLAAMLGPWTATVVMFCVLLVQALLFQDGGLTVLGANLINMGILGTFGGWALVRVLAPAREGWRHTLALFLAGWLTVVGGALTAALELGISGSAPLGPALWTMGTVHLVVGVIEGLVTVAAVRFMKGVRLGLLEGMR